MKYIFIDTETSGLEPDNHDILQLAWCLTDESYRPIHTCSFFMQRTLPATEKAISVNGLTDAFLKDNASDPYEVYTALLKDLGQADMIVAHYAPFDKAFIVNDSHRRISGEMPQEADRIKAIILGLPVLDTKQNLIGLNPQWSQKKHPGPYLDELCNFLGVETRELRFHRADADVEAMRLCLVQIQINYRFG